MICKDCRTAGDLNAIAAYQAARTAHTVCQYPLSCPCQHRIGDQWHATS